MLLRESPNNVSDQPAFHLLKRLGRMLETHLIRIQTPIQPPTSTLHMPSPHTRPTMLYNGEDSWSSTHVCTILNVHSIDLYSHMTQNAPYYRDSEQYYTHSYRDVSYSPPQVNSTFTFAGLDRLTQP